MSDKEDISIGSFINKHSSPLIKSYGIYHSHSDVFDMMKDYAESYHKHQMSKELEELLTELVNAKSEIIQGVFRNEFVHLPTLKMIFKNHGIEYKTPF